MLKHAVKSGIGMPTIHLPSGAQELTAHPSWTGEHWHAENSLTISRVLKLFTTTRSKATKALASAVSGTGTTGVFGSNGFLSTHKGLVFVSGSRRILR